jgi:hypothetical protein
MTTGMAGTNERRKSIVDEGWEPMKPSGPSGVQIVLIFAAALVIIPLVAFWASFTLLSR